MKIVFPVRNTGWNDQRLKIKKKEVLYHELGMEDDHRIHYSLDGSHLYKTPPGNVVGYLQIGK
jgi:hypothetical protein